MALTLLGEASITSLDDELDSARAIKRLYTIALDAALRNHNWNFAQLRRTLARHSIAPEWEFSYQYTLPTDPYCLRVLETSLDTDEPWGFEIAYRASYAITRNATLTASLQKEKELAWRQARSRDGQESRALKSLLSDSFTKVR